MIKIQIFYSIDVVARSKKMASGIYSTTQIVCCTLYLLFGDEKGYFGYNNITIQLYTLLLEVTHVRLLVILSIETHKFYFHNVKFPSSITGNGEGHSVLYFFENQVIQIHKVGIICQKDKGYFFIVKLNGSDCRTLKLQK